MTWHVEFSDIIFLWLNIQVTSGPIEESGEKTTVVCEAALFPLIGHRVRWKDSPHILNVVYSGTTFN